MMAIPKSQCVALCVWRLVFEENIRTGIYRHSLWLLYTTLKGPDSCIASCPVCLGQKTAPGPTANSAADSQIASKFCACVKGNTSPCNQVAVVCVCHFKWETRRLQIQQLQKQRHF